jgi:hypothetical protein
MQSRMPVGVYGMFGGCVKGIRVLVWLGNSDGTVDSVLFLVLTAEYYPLCIASCLTQRSLQAEEACA